MESMSYFKSIQGAYGVQSKNEQEVREAQRRLKYDMQLSVNLMDGAKRNGVEQNIIAVPTQTPYKYTVIAFPGDDLFTGDMLEFKDRHWLVVEVPSAPVMHYTGVVWECNHLFRFQTFDGEIVERWGVIDTGNYSSDVQHGSMLTDTNSQYRLYMQLDDQTKQIFIDKRLAIAQIFDQSGKQILDVYKVTDVDPVTQSYGGGHLLSLRAESDAYNESTDSIELMICDMIDIPDKPDPGVVSLVIDGPNEIRYGFSRDYFASISGTTPLSEDEIIFSWSINGNEDILGFIELQQNNGVATVNVNRGAQIGDSFDLVLDTNIPDSSSVTKKITVVGLI